MQNRFLVVLLVIRTVSASSHPDDLLSWSPPSWSPPVPEVSSSESSGSNSSLSPEVSSVSFFETVDEYKKAIKDLAERERESTSVDLEDKKVTFTRMGKEWHLVATSGCIFKDCILVESKFYIEAMLCGNREEHIGQQSVTFKACTDDLCRSHPPSVGAWSILEENGLVGSSVDKYFKVVSGSDDTVG